MHDAGTAVQVGRGRTGGGRVERSNWWTPRRRQSKTGPPNVIDPAQAACLPKPSGRRWRVKRKRQKKTLIFAPILLPWMAWIIARLRWAGIATINRLAPKNHESRMGAIRKQWPQDFAVATTSSSQVKMSESRSGRGVARQPEASLAWGGGDVRSLKRRQADAEAPVLASRLCTR